MLSFLYNNEKRKKLIEEIRFFWKKNSEEIIINLHVGNKHSLKDRKCYYRKDVDTWASFYDYEGRYFNAFGVGSPKLNTRISVEVNPSIDVLTETNVQGVILEDSDGGLALAHLGRLGGKHLVKKIDFQKTIKSDFFQKKYFARDKKINSCFVVYDSKCDVSENFKKISSYTRECDRIRNIFHP